MRLTNNNGGYRGAKEAIACARKRRIYIILVGYGDDELVHATCLQ